VIGRHGDVELSKTLRVIADLAIPLSPIEILGPKVMIESASGKTMIDRDEKDVAV
jgi:hypothetical protein